MFNQLCLFSISIFHYMLKIKDLGIEIVVSMHLFLIVLAALFRNLCACANQMPVTQILEPVSSTSRREARVAYRDEYPRDFGSRIAYILSQVSDTCRPPIRQRVKDMSAPRPYETYPFHPLSSVLVV